MSIQAPTGKSGLLDLSKNESLYSRDTNKDGFTGGLTLKGWVYISSQKHDTKEFIMEFNIYYFIYMCVCVY